MYKVTMLVTLFIIMIPFGKGAVDLLTDELVSTLLNKFEDNLNDIVIDGHYGFVPKDEFQDNEFAAIFCSCLNGVVPGKENYDYGSWWADLVLNAGKGIHDILVGAGDIDVITYCESLKIAEGSIPVFKDDGTVDLVPINTDNTCTLTKFDGLGVSLRGVVTKQIPELDSNVLYALGNLSDILHNTNKITGLLTKPFSFTASNDDDVTSLASTLETCFTSLTDAVLGELKELELLDALDILPYNIDNVVYQLTAVSLLPIKSQIEFVCINNEKKQLNMVIDGIKAVINMKLPKLPPISTRRRTMFETNNQKESNGRRLLYENDKCTPDKDGFCEPASEQYQKFDTGKYENWGGSVAYVISDLLEAAWRWGPGGHAPPYATQTYCSKTTKFIWRIIEMIITELYQSMKADCASVVKCAADVQASCKPSTVCKWRKRIGRSILVAIDKIRWAIDLHNGHIDFVRLEALRMDRYNIIHNQHALKKYLGKLITLGSLSTQNAIENERYSLQFISRKIQDLHQAFNQQNNRISTLSLQFPTKQISVLKCKGHYFDIEAIKDLTITRLSWVSWVEGAEFKWYEKSGSYKDFEEDPSAWSELCEGIGSSKSVDGDNKFIGTTKSNCENVDMRSGETRGFYLYLKGDVICQEYGNEDDVLKDDANLKVRTGVIAADDVFGGKGKVGYLYGAKLEYTVSVISAESHGLNIDFEKIEKDTHEGAGVITITLKISDVYIFGMVLLGLCISCIGIGWIMAIYCQRGRSTAQFALVPKFDYSTSDLEDGNE
eukprot:49936_1